jgi:glyoxylase-like metal-dependent hydrolase (beta-lactamase superfamily II)
MEPSGRNREAASTAHLARGNGCDGRPAGTAWTPSALLEPRTRQDQPMSVLAKITEHVYWMPPGAPDRPSLCAVVGNRRSLMLDAGSSKAHARTFLDALSTEGVARPSALVYTHSDWDHVFGGAELGAPVIAHVLTAEQLVELADTDWSDEALDQRVAAGQASPQHAAAVKQELPSPRTVEVTPADIVFREGVDIELGGVTVRVRHVGGNHSADSSVMHIEPDRVLFLGDCTYASPAGALTAEVAFPLYDAILAFDAELYVEGHHEVVLSRPDIEALAEKMRLAEKAVREGSGIPISDEDTEYFVQAFRAGRASASEDRAGEGGGSDDALAH